MASSYQFISCRCEQVPCQIISCYMETVEIVPNKFISCSLGTTCEQVPCQIIRCYSIWRNGSHRSLSAVLAERCEQVPRQIISCYFEKWFLTTTSLSHKIFPSDISCYMETVEMNGSQPVYQLFYVNDVNSFPARLSAVMGDSINCSQPVY